MGKLDSLDDRMEPQIPDDFPADTVALGVGRHEQPATDAGRRAAERAIEEVAAATAASMAAKKAIEDENDTSLSKGAALMVRRGTEGVPIPPKAKGGVSAIRTIPELLGRPKSDVDTPAGRTYDYPFARLADQKVAVVALKIHDLDATVGAILAIAEERGWKPLAVFGEDASARARLIEMAFERDIPVSPKDPQDIAFLDRLREQRSAAPTQRMRG